jgi:HEPN domain-containing protein
MLATKAQLDLNAASELLSKSDLQIVGYETIGFHLQQAVEKSTKSLLERHDIPCSSGHDLKNLFKKVDERLSPIPPRFQPLLELTPFATEFRYVTTVPEITFDCHAFLLLASDYMDWVATMM